MYYAILIIISIFVLSAFFNESFSQSVQPDVGPLMSVGTDKLSYAVGDNIVIFGTVKPVSVPSLPVLIEITDPNNNTVSTSKVNVSSEGAFLDTIKAGGDLWKNNGLYTVKAQYGSPIRKVQISFNFTGYAPAQDIQSQVLVEGTNISVSYSFPGGTIQSIQTNSTTHSILLNVLTHTNSSLIIDLPRVLIDSSSNGNDIPFYVLINNSNPIKYQDMQTTFKDRRLNIPVQNGVSQIEIIGTRIIPEFSSLTSMALMIAISSIILFSLKSKIKFYN